MPGASSSGPATARGYHDMSGARRIVVALLATTALAAAMWALHGVGNPHAARRAHRDRALHVDTAAVRTRAVPVLVQAVGQVQSQHTVQIRPQVGGMLKRAFFSEGDTVKAGQRLFEIDPAPYAAQLASAKAAWDNAKAQYERLAPLKGRDYATAQEIGDARATADQAEAAYEQARINLSYTDIRAPITGRTGGVSVKPGNLVAPGDTAPLVVINQMNPILVQYTIPQQSLSAVREHRRKGTIRIFVTHEDGTGDLGRGKLVFIDNSVDPTTATVMLKARVPNQDERLWPGQYVGVRMQLAVQSDAVVVPETAVQVGQGGNFVYVVEDGAARIRNVTVDRRVADLAVIASGLTPGQTVVSRIPRNLRPGAAVTTASARPASAPHR